MTHVEGEVDPVRDLEIISEELRLKDEEKLDQTLEKMERTVVRANDKKLKPEYVRMATVRIFTLLRIKTKISYNSTIFILGRFSKSESSHLGREETHSFC